MNSAMRANKMAPRDAPTPAPIAVALLDDFCADGDIIAAEGEDTDLVSVEEDDKAEAVELLYGTAVLPDINAIVDS
jgi:hypothetical protein